MTAPAAARAALRRKIKRARTPCDIDRRAGVRVRALREQAGRSLMSLAEDLAISWQQLQKYESGANRMSLGRACQVAEALGVTLEDLVE